jgi:hypothetical protein
MNDSQKLLKSILGDRGYETLEKAIYKQRTQAVIDPLEYYLPLIVVPRTILSWLIQTIKPMKPGEKLDVKFPGRDEILIHIEKQDIDQYRAEFTSGGRVIHAFEKQSLPAASAHMMTVGELYDSFGDHKPDIVPDQTKTQDEPDDTKKESYQMVQHMMDSANIKPSEDPENVKWTMSHASIREMTAVIGKLVDALTAKQLSRNRLESELDKVSEKETDEVSNKRDLMTNTKPVPKKDPVGLARVDTPHPETPFKKEAIKTNEIVTDNAVSGHRQKPGSPPKKDPVGMARTDAPHDQKPFSPGKAESSQKPETPFKKEAIKTNEIMTDNAVSGHEQKPGSPPKKDPVGMARTDAPHGQTPFKPGVASPSQKPETPFKKEDAPMTPVAEDTPRPSSSIPSTYGSPYPKTNADPKLGKSYFRKKHEILTKPYVSEAQRGKFHAMADRGEISRATVEHWDKASKGKKLPEHVKKEEKGASEKQVTSHSVPTGGGGMANVEQPKGNSMMFPVIKDEMTAKAEAPKGAGAPQGPGIPKAPKPPVPASNAPGAAAAKQATQASKGIIKPPKLAGTSKPANSQMKPKMPSSAKPPPVAKSGDYFRSKLGKNEVLQAHATEEQLYKSACQNCGVAEFVRGEDGHPRYNPCACFLVTKKDEEGRPQKFVKILKKNDGAFDLEFIRGADPETVKLFLLTLKARLLIKRKHGL